MLPAQRPQPANRPAGSDGYELGLIVVLGAVMLAAGVIYAGAWLAAITSGGHVRGGLSELLPVVGHLAQHPGDPGAAWGPLATGLASPTVYWACTIAVVIVATGLATTGLMVWRRRSRSGQARLGVEPDARMAKRGDVAPIVIKSAVPPVGRMLLGRLAPRGPMLATEDRERHPLRGRRAEARQGDRGSVALIGPTRSGKTVLASAGC